MAPSVWRAAAGGTAAGPWESAGRQAHILLGTKGGQVSAAEALVLQAAASRVHRGWSVGWGWQEGGSGGAAAGGGRPNPPPKPCLAHLRRPEP